MATTGEELDRFSTFVRQRIGTGGANLSLDDLFDLWRTENPPESLYAENVAAVNAAIADFRNGDRGTPAGEHSAQLRTQFGIAAE
jgi:hypothetical protein